MNASWVQLRVLKYRVYPKPYNDKPVTQSWMYADIAPQKVQQ
jgi:hypothetical protein